MTIQTLTQELLKIEFNYNQNTGIFTRLLSGHGTKKGDVAKNKSSNGYITITIFSKKYSVHRLAWLYMTGSWPKEQIDHINGIRDDNRWINLRECTQQQNQFNSFKNKNNTSGYKGVYYHKESNKWYSQAGLNNKKIYLGSYEKKEEAYNAYIEFSKLNHGNYFKQI